MNSFFANLVDRHLGTCDIVQPRKLGRFETDRGNVVTAFADEGTAPVQSENDQTLQTPSEFSVDSPTRANRKHDPVENNKGFPSPSRPEQNNPAARPALSEERVAFSDFGAHAYQGTPKREQLDATALPDKQRLFTDKTTLTDNNQLHEKAHNKNPAPASSPGEHVLDNELNHRIGLMLKRLTDETRAPAQDDRGSQRNETYSAILPATQAQLFDSAISSLDLPHASSRQTSLEENRISKHSNNRLHSQLEPLSWLTEMESRFNQHALQKQANAEPVINVTIGRVEVRAVQAEATNNARHSKKPTGVMSLDDYLKQRDGRRTR